MRQGETCRYSNQLQPQETTMDDWPYETGDPVNVDGETVEINK